MTARVLILMRMGKLKKNSLVHINLGQSLLELIIALGIFVVGVATLGFLVLDAKI